MLPTGRASLYSFGQAANLTKSHYKSEVTWLNVIIIISWCGLSKIWKVLEHYVSIPWFLVNSGLFFSVHFILKSSSSVSTCCYFCFCSAFYMLGYNNDLEKQGIAWRWGRRLAFLFEWKTFKYSPGIVLIAGLHHCVRLCPCLLWLRGASCSTVCGTTKSSLVLHTGREVKEAGLTLSTSAANNFHSCCKMLEAGEIGSHCHLVIRNP